MAKFKIWIYDGVEREFDSKEDAVSWLNFMSPPTSQPVPDYSRQEVLEEKWKVSTSDPCCVIDRDNKIWNFLATAYDDQLKRKVSFWASVLYAHPIVFAPTLHLAIEIVHIRENKWLPKAGDRICMTDRAGNIHLEELWTANDESYFDLRKCIYYPSLKQREKYAPKISKGQSTPPQTSISLAERDLFLLAEKLAPILFDYDKLGEKLGKWLNDRDRQSLLNRMIEHIDDKLNERVNHVEEIEGRRMWVKRWLKAERDHLNELLTKSKF